MGPQGQDQKPKPKPKPCLPQTCKGGGSRELCLGSCGSGFSRKILIFGAGPKSSRLKPLPQLCGWAPLPRRCEPLERGNAILPGHQVHPDVVLDLRARSEEHTSALQSLKRISYA